MHDTDRISTETAFYETGDHEDSFAFEFEEGFEAGETGEVFDELDEIDLASQMMEITDEAEFDYFLGNLFRKAAGAVGKVIKSPVGKALGGMLKGAVKKYAPMAGSALGGRIAGAAGSRLGGKVASGLVSAIGLEVVEEGEDQEFAAARRFVRTAGAAAAKAAKSAGVDPKEVARRALIEAAQKFLPGLVGETGPAGAAAGAAMAPAAQSGGHSGRWIRRGSRIVLMGV
jgi:hypothetical protein